MRQEGYRAGDYRHAIERGLTIAEAARELGVSKQAAAQAYRRYGARGLSKRERYARLAAQGLTRAEAAEKLGVTVGAVGAVARRWGLVFTSGKPGAP